MATARFPYRITVEWSEEDGAFVGRVPALPGCASHGDSADEAAREAITAASGILDSMKAHGEAPPAPDLGRGLSGNIRLRLPRSLHQRLASRADLEGVSLNQLMVAILAQGGSGGMTPGEVIAQVEHGSRARRALTKPRSRPGLKAGKKRAVA